MQKIAKYNGYDGIIMLNLFPLVSPNPSELPKEIKLNYHKQNLKYIKEIFSIYEQKKYISVLGRQYCESKIFMENITRHI